MNRDDKVGLIVCILMLLGIVFLFIYENSTKVYDPLNEVEAYCIEKGFTSIGYDSLKSVNFVCFNDGIDKLEFSIRSQEFRDWNRTYRGVSK